MCQNYSYSSPIYKVEKCKTFLKSLNVYIRNMRLLVTDLLFLNIHKTFYFHDRGSQGERW